MHTVTAGGPAAKAGIKAGDVITAIDGHATAGADAVIAAIRSIQPGQQISVTYERGGSTNTVDRDVAAESSTELVARGARTADPRRRRRPAAA